MKINLVVDIYHNDKSHSIKNEFLRNGFSISKSDYDITVFVGGDGTFANRALEFAGKPLLFMSRHFRKENGSLSYNSQANVDVHSLKKVSRMLSDGDYTIVEEPVLVAKKNGVLYKSIYDFFVERYGTKEAMRYKVDIRDGNTHIESYGISNGFIISTPLGSTGYYSYLDRLKSGRPKRIPSDSIGFAHILPVKMHDIENGKPVIPMARRRFSDSAIFKVSFERNVGQMLFGMKGNDGVKVNRKDSLRFYLSKDIAIKMIRLKS